MTSLIPVPQRRFPTSYLVAGAVVAAIFLALALLERPSSGGGNGASLAAPVAATTAPFTACEDLHAVVDEARSAPADSRPQMSNNQLSWIAREVRLSWEAQRTPPHFLVFGLGWDTTVWKRVNCRGRTVFLENMQDWIDGVSAAVPGLEVYKVEYNTSVGKIDQFMEAGRWSMDVPQNVYSDCFDVILIDSPMGYGDNTPGRFQPAQFALENAEQCIRSGRKHRVVVFLHDAIRNGEKRIVQDMFETHPLMHRLGYSDIHLVGFEMTPPSAAVSRHHLH